MTTVSIDEAAKTLPTLIKRAQSETVIIRDGDEDVAILSYLPPRAKSKEEREAALERMQAMSQKMSEELKASLAKDGISVEEFLADALSDV